MEAAVGSAPRASEFEFVGDRIDAFLRDTATLAASMRKAARADLVTLAAREPARGSLFESGAPVEDRFPGAGRLGQ
jgi:hypothetical protein